MDFAVIKTGGKQYLVRFNQKLKIEKIDKKEGEEITFNEVLLLGDKSGNVKIGEPFVSDAKVKAKILSQGRGKKVIVFKYKPKKRYKKKQGHRQSYTEIQIEKILEK